MWWYNGAAWEAKGAQASLPANAYSPNIAIDSQGVPYVAVLDCDNSCAGSVLRYSSEAGEWQFMGARGFTGGWSPSPSLAFDGTGTPLYGAVVSSNGKTYPLLYRWSSAASAWALVGPKDVMGAGSAA